MNVDFLSTILDNIFSNRKRKNKPKADMYLPDYVMTLGVVMLCVGAGFVIAFIFLHAVWMMVTAAIAVLIGVAALMCWKNQMIRIVSDKKFEYTTFWGNKYTYYFDEITKIRKNSDSTTVFIGKRKVHIEENAIVSIELRKKLNEARKNKV